MCQSALSQPKIAVGATYAGLTFGSGLIDDVPRVIGRPFVVFRVLENCFVSNVEELVHSFRRRSVVDVVYRSHVVESNVVVC